MKLSIAYLALVAGVVSAGRPQLSVSLFFCRLMGAIVARGVNFESSSVGTFMSGRILRQQSNSSSLSKFPPSHATMPTPS
jgi:hypothetical protein